MPSIDDDHVDEEAEFWQAVLRRERGTVAQAFVYAVKSTGVYCRAYCPSKRPGRMQVRFFCSAAEAKAAGFRPCLRCNPSAEGGQVSRGEQAISLAREVLDNRFDDEPTLSKLAQEVGLSPTYLQRAFKQAVGVSPHEYASARRMERFRAGLQSGESVGQAMVEAGFGSTSRVYEGRKAEARLGATPGVYRKARPAMRVRYVVDECKYGFVLIAATERGICSITLGDDADPLVKTLRQEYAGALPLEDGDAESDSLTTAAGAIMRHLSGLEPSVNLPLDVRATAFQRQVWQALQAIPYGETRSYRQVAESLGQPTASRAVAGACASNPVALVVPCHRVVRSGGEISGYRWGVERKKALLAIECGQRRDGEAAD